MDANLNKGAMSLRLMGLRRGAEIGMGARAALRAIPALAILFDRDVEVSRRDSFVLPTLRNVIFACVKAVDFPAVTGGAIHSAAEVRGSSAARAMVAAELAARIGDGDTKIAVTAIDRAASASPNSRNTWLASENDLTFFDSGRNAKEVFSLPLWSDKFLAANEIDQAYRFISKLSKSGGELRFWFRWYEGMVDGNPIDWAIQREIAQIRPYDWGLGLSHIASRIAEIEGRYLVAATPIAEKIEWKEASSKLHAIPSQIANVRLYETALQRVRLAIGDLMQNGTLAQHHHALGKIVKKLNRTLDTFADNPQLVHDDFLLSAKQIRSLAKAGEYQVDEDTEALENTLITGADDIRAADADVRASVTARVNLRIDELRFADTEIVGEAMIELAAISEGPLKERLEDIGAEILVAARSWTDQQAPLIGAANRDERVDQLYQAAAYSSRASILLKGVYANSAKIGLALPAGYTFAEIILKQDLVQNILISLFY